MELVDRPSEGSWAVEVDLVHQGKLSHLGQRKDSRLASAVPLRERGGRSVRGEERSPEKDSRTKNGLFAGRSGPRQLLVAAVKSAPIRVLSQGSPFPVGGFGRYARTNFLPLEQP